MTLLIAYMILLGVGLHGCLFMMQQAASQRERRLAAKVHNLETRLKLRRY